MAGNVIMAGVTTDDERLTAERAAGIAHRHRLTLADAVALRGLTDNLAEAERIAEQFAGDDAENDMSAALRRRAGR